MKSINYRGLVIEPSKIVCVGRNYVAHIEELNNEIPDQPVIFIKPNSSISTQLQISTTEPISYETELSFLIMNGQINGVAIGLDLTKREAQSKLKAKGLPWERAKAFDGAAVFSEFVLSPDSTADIKFELEINGRLVQQGNLNLMINAPDILIADIASFMSFEDGDILMTGTPSGVGIANVDDVFVGRVFDGEILLVEQQWKATASAL